MGEVKTTFLWSLRDNVSAGAKKVDNALDGVGIRSKGAAGALGKLSVATGGLVTPTSLAASGALALVGGLATVTGMAIDEEKNIAKLSASLKANVPAWDGTTAAIEKQIAQSEKLAFSDDDLRDSLAKLVAATHNVGDAFKIQNTAMDLARFKGISLADATEALTKVEAGSYRILKSLGIVLKDGATQQEALAAVQAVTFGQAEAYANKTAGKLEAAQIRINDKMEDFGARILPIVVSSLDSLVGAMDFWSDASLGDKLFAGLPGYTTDAQRATDAATALAVAAQAVGGFWYTSAGKVESAVHDMAGKVKIDTRSAANAFAGMTERMHNSAQDALDRAFDPLIRADDLLADHATLAAAKRVLASKTASAAVKADARSTILSVSKDAAELLLKMAESGQAGDAAYALGLKDLDAAIAKATGSARKALQDFRAELLKTAKVAAGAGISVVIRATGHPTAEHRAHGGPVSANTPYLVGEEGPELFIPNPGGAIIPNGGTGGGGGGGSNVTVVFQSNFAPTAAQAREIVALVSKGQYYDLQRSPPTIGRT